MQNNHRSTLGVTGTVYEQKVGGKLGCALVARVYRRALLTTFYCDVNSSFSSDTDAQDTRPAWHTSYEFRSIL